MMKMTDAEKNTQTRTSFKDVKCVSANIKHKRSIFRTYDGEDECVGEVSVERELHHVPPQPQQLHRLSQTHKDVTTQSRNSCDKN